MHNFKHKNYSPCAFFMCCCLFCLWAKVLPHSGHLRCSLAPWVALRWKARAWWELKIFQHITQTCLWWSRRRCLQNAFTSGSKKPHTGQVQTAAALSCVMWLNIWLAICWVWCWPSLPKPLPCTCSMPAKLQDFNLQDPEVWPVEKWVSC